MNKNHRPSSEFRTFNRMEITIAEIMRINYPLSTYSSDESALWFDIVDDFSEMFATKDDRFDKDGFLERCFGEEWSNRKAAQEQLDLIGEALAQAEALDAEVIEVQT